MRCLKRPSGGGNRGPLEAALLSPSGCTRACQPEQKPAAEYIPKMIFINTYRKSSAGMVRQRPLSFVLGDTAEPLSFVLVIRALEWGGTDGKWCGRHALELFTFATGASAVPTMALP